MSTRVDIKKDLIIWGIRRAGYDVSNFIEEKFPKAGDWLNQETKPTIPQLRDFAKKIYLPFGYLFVDNPPDEKLPIPYYRTYNGETNEVSLNVRDTIITLEKRQDWLKEYLIENENEPLDFVGKFDISSDLKTIVADIRKRIGFNEYWSEEIPTWSGAKRHIKKKFEEAGIIVVSTSYVGLNTNRKISVDDCRGFVLVDDYVPFMFVNSADSQSAQIFTLIHELAHIWFGESAGFDFSNLQPSKNRIEKKCNAVAAELLAPEELFLGFWDINQDFSWLAERLKVSPIVVARRALDLGKIPRETFFHFYNGYIKKINEQKTGSDSPGGTFYNNLFSKLNPRFLRLVNEAVKNDKLLYQEAFEITGLRGKTYDSAIKKLED